MNVLEALITTPPTAATRVAAPPARGRTASPALALALVPAPVLVLGAGAKSSIGKVKTSVAPRWFR
jgi:hypothetical protein